MPPPLYRAGKGRRAAVWMTVLILAGCGALSAQQSIMGEVKDASTGVALAEAEVHIVDNATRTDHVTASGESGRFSVLDLPPGAFEVTIRKDGFLSERSQVSLTPRRVLTLEVALQPATADSETVVVDGQVDLFDTQRAQTSVVMSRVDLEQIPGFQQTDIPKLVSRTVPGAIQGHDNFIHLKGNELSLHQFVDGVAFLDNPHSHFTPGLTPRIIESVNVITGGMPAEFGSRAGGILDIVTKSGRNVGGGSVTLGAGTIVGRDAAFEYGIGRDKWDAYFLGSGFSDGRFLNPPQQREIHDLGYGSRSVLKLGFRPGDNDRLSLLVSGGGINFQLPNTTEELLLGRDPLRRTRETSAVLRWQRALSADALLTTSAYNRYVSDRLVGTSDPVTPFGQGFRRTATTGAKVDLLYYAAGHTLKAGLDASVISLNEDLIFDPREEAHEEAEEAAHENGLSAAPAFVWPKALLPGPFARVQRSGPAANPVPRPATGWSG
ncbi:MAG: TonB-dependent receptor [Acidobacteria bacterium]|nr:TonB-dependent receptor [Acidobacteriota bacterium]